MRTRQSFTRFVIACGCVLTAAIGIAGCQPANTATKTEPTSEPSAGSEVAAKPPADAKPVAAASQPTASAGSSLSVSPTGWVSFRNGNDQRGIATSLLPEKLELLWKYPLQYGVISTAAIVEDRVYVGAMNGEVLCLNRDSGELVWKYRSVDDPNPETFAPGFPSSPHVTADTVYIGDEDGVLHALDRATGKRRWKYASGAEIPGGAAIVGDRVLFGSHDSYLYCLNAADGSEVWKYQTQDMINCSLAISNGKTFVAGCDQKLRVIDIETGMQVSELDLGSPLIASPAVIDNILYVGTHAGVFVAVDWQKPEVLWQFKDPKREQEYRSSAAVTDKYVLVGCRDKRLHCLDRATGEQVWEFVTRAQVDSSPVVVGDRVYFGSADKNLYGLSLADGKEVFKFNAGGDVTAGPAVGENVLVVGTEENKGEILCFGAKPAGKE